MCDQVSFTQLDSGPGAMPLASFERVRQLWVRNTTERDVRVDERVRSPSGSSSVPALRGLCEELRRGSPRGRPLP